MIYTYCSECFCILIAVSRRLLEPYRIGNVFGAASHLWQELENSMALVGVVVVDNSNNKFKLNSFTRCASTKLNKFMS